MYEIMRMIMSDGIVRMIDEDDYAGFVGFQ